MDESKEKKSTEKPVEKPEKGDDGSASKKKRKTDVEPRTPLKRQRVPVQKYQSPAAEEIIPTPSTSKQKEQTELLHKRGCFLAVRGDEGTFYLCKTAQNVFSNTRKFKIQWLDLDQPPDIYKIDFLDSTDADCILTNVKMEKVVKDTFRLPQTEQKRVEAILNKALKKERGEPIDEAVPEEEEEEEEDEDEDEPTPKKSKSESKSKKGVTVSLKGKDKKSKSGKSTKDKKSEKKDKKSKKEEKKKGPDRNLQPNLKMKVLEKEPFFETRDKVEFISKTVHGKLAIRAIQLNDMEMLKTLMENKDQVYNLNVFRSVDVKKDALHYALETNNHDAIKLLVKDFFMKNERTEKGTAQSVLISKSYGGSYNPLSLGVSAIRPLAMSRGSKEGNDAFVKDLGNDVLSYEDYIIEAMKLGCSTETLETLLTANTDYHRGDLIYNAVQNIYLAVLSGNRKLAGKLIEEAMKDDGGSGFGYLHKDVLLFDKEELRTNILAASCRKKPWDNKSITPLHCAAINPNVAYLQRLLAVEPDMNIEDREHRRPIHFAAVCEGVAPLEFLLQRGANPLECDNQGQTPLHYACSAGRPRNVDILLKKAKEVSEKHGDVFTSKWGPGGVDKPSRSSYCPVHIAVTYGHAHVLKILIKHQVNINKALSAGKNKMTPLMIASSHGFLDIARILVQNGASIEVLDKLKRSALTHAIMNGNTHVASYLLYLGADPNRCDSSGNSLVHYAAAYGWQFCLKLLMEAGADPCGVNFWKTTPVNIAFLKGHIGLVDRLLKLPGVDINFKNDEGMTLCSIAASSALVPGLYEQMKYLIKEKKADPTIRDGRGMDTLHHLANSTIKNSWEKPEKEEEKMELTLKIAELLLNAGCDPTAVTDDDKTALMFAIEKMNSKLVTLLVENGGSVTSKKNSAGSTMLHMMATQCMDSDLSPILKVLVDQGQVVVGVTSKKNSTGSTMLHMMATQCMDSDLSPILKVLVEKKQKVMPKVEKPSKIEKAKAAAKAVENGESEEVGEKKEEAMEVDGEGDKPTDKSGDAGSDDKPKQNGGGDVNGMDVDETPDVPPLKRQNTESQEKIWSVMAAERDLEGFTPLLRACKTYRDYHASGQTNEAIKKASENGRSFIKAIIEMTESDVSAVVGEKFFSDDIPAEEKNRYCKEGKSSVLHLLLHVGHEILEDINGMALALVLNYKPNLEHRDMENKTALIVAVESHSEKAIEKLIRAGADVNCSYGDEAVGNLTPLHAAARDGKAGIVKLLVDAKAKVNVVNEKTKEAPLHLAVQNRDDEANGIEVARLILDAGADINMGPCSPLHYAVRANTGTTNASTELEEFLVGRGANVFARDDKKRVPLHYAFISQGKPNSVSTVDPIELVSVLTDAMRNKELEAKDENGRSPLHLAAIRGATISCIHLMQRNVSVNAKDDEGFTAISLAVKYKHDSCAITLLQKGADVANDIKLKEVTKADDKEYYTLHNKKKLPIWKWSPFRFTQPVKKPEDFDIYSMAISGELQGVAHMVLDATGVTGKAIESALKTNKYHIALRHLHRVKNASIVKDYVNSDGQNLLHILAYCTEPGREKQLQLKVAKALVEKGVSLKQQDKYKRYPIMYAALKHQSVGLAKFLLDKSQGLDLNMPDVYGRTVMVAYFWDQERIYKHPAENNDWISMLTGVGATLDIVYSVSVPDTPLFDISIADHPLDFFISLDKRSTTTPLISAINNSDFGLTKFLLQNGASPNMPDCDGVTPLMYAAKLYTQIHSLDKRSTTTPLISAINNSDFGLTKFLLKNGASPNMPDCDGVTPLMYAAKLNDLSMVKLLLNYDYEVNESGSGHSTGMFGLRKQLSRQVFAIMPRGDTADDADGDDDDEMNENDDGNDDDAMDNDDGDDGDDMDEDEDSDHDTDVVDDDEEEHDVEAPHLPIPRLGTKQPSMKKLQSSLSAKDEFPVVEKTSDVDINAKDKKGWTVVHHLVRPLDMGSYENEEMLYVLGKCGAKVTLVNNDGETPLKMAQKVGASLLAKRLVSLISQESDAEEDKAALLPFVTMSEAEKSLLEKSTSYQTDADSVLAKLNEPSADQAAAALKPKVDKQCVAVGVGEVMFDDSNKMPYDITLSKIEVRNHLNDMYNFYKMQIIWHKPKDIYILFTKWGRIGDVGMFQQTPFQTLPEAVKEFQRIFKSKSGNNWSNIKNFQNMPKKYRLVELDNQPRPVVKVDFNLQCSIPSKLPEQVQDLITEMADIGMMQASLKKAKMAEEYMPFGRIKRTALIEARKRLQQIGEIVLDIEKKKREFTYDPEEHYSNCEKISKLSTEYYSLIPQEGYAFDRLHPLDSLQNIKLEMRLITYLYDLEIASKIMLGAQSKLTESNPLDYIYQSIGCLIQPLREEDTESQYILKYIRSSTSTESHQPKVLGIYRLSRKGEEGREKFTTLDNHKLLWHGTDVSNVIGILHKGLLVAPPEAPLSGSAFGEGVYTADTFTKSQQYCHNYNPKSNVKMAFLCEVALGNSKVATDNSADLDLVNSEYNSLLIQGRRGPSSDWDLTLPYGGKIPLGSVQNSSWKSPEGYTPWIPHSEYIVQDCSQISLRYLVQFV